MRLRARVGSLQLIARDGYPTRFFVSNCRDAHTDERCRLCVHLHSDSIARLYLSAIGKLVNAFSSIGVSKLD